MADLNDRELNETLSKWLLKPVGEPIEEVINRVLTLPAEKQQTIKAVMEKVLAEQEPAKSRGPLGKEEEGALVILKAWVAYLFLLTLGIAAKETAVWALGGVEAGTCSLKTAHKLIMQEKELFDEAERRLSPIIDQLMRYEAARSGMELAALELYDEVENQVVALELKAAAARIGS